MQLRRRRRKEGEKYLKSETVNPAFEAEEGGPAGGTGGALARGDDFERLRVPGDGGAAAAANGTSAPVGTPKSAKGLSGKRAGGAAAAAAGGGALGALIGGRRKVGHLLSYPSVIAPLFQGGIAFTA